MTQVRLLFDYIEMLLSKQPLDFDIKKSMCIKLLNELKSLENNHNTILAIKRWIFETDMTEKYFEDDIKKTDNILIYYKERLKSQQIKFIESQLQHKEATIESKKKLLNTLTVIDLNQRLLQRKSKEELEQAQQKLVEVRETLHTSSDIYNQLHTKNIINNAKADELLAHMKSVEVQSDIRDTDFEFNINELKKVITEISKEIISDSSLNSKENKRKLGHELMNSKSNILNPCTEQTDIINNYINEINESKPLLILSQNESLYGIDWTEFLMNYNLAHETFLLDVHQKCNSVITVITLLDKLNDTEQTLNSSIKNTTFTILNVQNEKNTNMTILEKLNEELDELKQNNSSMIMSHRESDHLKFECIKHVSDLENSIQQSNTRSTVSNKYNKKLNYDLQRSNLIFEMTSQKYINQVNNAYRILLLDDKKLNKGIFLHDKLRTLKNTHNELLEEQNKIVLDKFNEKISALEALLQIKSKNIVENRNIIIHHKKNKNNYNQITSELKYLNSCTENSYNDLLTIYHKLVFNNHGKTMKQLEEEEIEFQRHIISYNNELDELNKENEKIENRIKFTSVNIKSQIKNINETLLQITSANESLAMGLKMNNIH